MLENLSCIYKLVEKHFLEENCNVVIKQFYAAGVFPFIGKVGKVGKDLVSFSVPVALQLNWGTIGIQGQRKFVMENLAASTIYRAPVPMRCLEAFQFVAPFYGNFHNQLLSDPWFVLFYSH